MFVTEPDEMLMTRTTAPVESTAYKLVPSVAMALTACAESIVVPVVLFAVLIGSSNYFYTVRHDGSVPEMTNSSGTVVWEQSFDPYGVPTTIIGTTPADFGYCGYYLHQRSGLNLTRARAYNASLGRFINRDPIEEAGGNNLYAYCDNDPIDDSDPSGLTTIAMPLPPWFCALFPGACGPKGGSGGGGGGSCPVNNNGNDGGGNPPTGGGPTGGGPPEDPDPPNPSPMAAGKRGKAISGGGGDDNDPRKRILPRHLTKTAR